MFLKMTPFFMHNRVFFGVSLWQLCRFEWIWVCLSEELYRIVWAFAGMKPTLRENERWRRDRALFIPTNYWHAETVEIVFRADPSHRPLTESAFLLISGKVDLAFLRVQSLFPLLLYITYGMLSSMGGLSSAGTRASVAPWPWLAGSYRTHSKSTAETMATQSSVNEVQLRRTNVRVEVPWALMMNLFRTTVRSHVLPSVFRTSVTPSLVLKENYSSHDRKC